MLKAKPETKTFAFREISAAFLFHFILVCYIYFSFPLYATPSNVDGNHCNVIQKCCHLITKK